MTKEQYELALTLAELQKKVKELMAQRSQLWKEHYDRVEALENSIAWLKAKCPHPEGLREHSSVYGESGWTCSICGYEGK